MCPSKAAAQNATQKSESPASELEKKRRSSMRFRKATLQHLMQKSYDPVCDSEKATLWHVMQKSYAQACEAEKATLQHVIPQKWHSSMRH
jgi:hypothetical protein